MKEDIPPDVDALFNSLDLTFSDSNPSSGENVRLDTMRHRFAIVKEAAMMDNCQSGINFSIWNRLGHNSPIAQIYVYNLLSDLRASIYLMLGGYYRQSIFLLRNWYELSLFGVYFQFVDRDEAAFKEWMQGTNRSAKIGNLYGKNLIKRLFGRAEFHRLDRRPKLKERMIAHYGRLSMFMHGSGLKRYDLHKESDNVPRLNLNSIDIWYSLLRKTFSLVVLCLYTACGPEIFFDLDIKERELLEHHVPKSWIEHSIFYSRKSDGIVGSMTKRIRSKA